MCATGRTASGTGSSGSCTPSRGYFFTSSNVNSQGTFCGTLPQHGASWNASQSGVSSQSECRFTCNSGYILNHLGRSCDIPDKGKYADASGVAANCSLIGGDSGGFKDFKKSKGAVSSATGCPFICNTGYVKVDSNSVRACNYPTKGKYGDGSTSTSLSCISNIGQGFKDWALPLGPVPTANDCPFFCEDLYTVDVTNRVCTPSPALTATAIGLGKNEACAILSNGRVKCWGGNPKSKPFVDLGTVTNSTTKHEAQTLSAGNQHTCVILKNGNSPHGPVKCWGDNRSGQLGLGHKNVVVTPQSVSLGSNVTAKALAAGNVHTCALLNDNSVKCWGDNYYGQLGLGSSQKADFYSTPQAVNLGNNVQAQTIVAGGAQTCVILKNGNSLHGPVKCWGWNNYGQLGLGSSQTDNSYDTPQAMDLSDTNGTTHTAKALAVGTFESCAILDDDSVKCWGSDSRGDTQRTPKAVDLGTVNGQVGGTQHTAQAVAVGHIHNCVILKNGSSLHGPVKCWGSNNSGQLGLGRNNTQHTPQKVDLGTVNGQDDGTEHTAQAIAVNGDSDDSYTCAILEDGRVKCWGSNNSGQLGLGPDLHGLTLAELQDKAVNDLILDREEAEALNRLEIIGVFYSQIEGHGGENQGFDAGPMGNGLPYLHFGF